jgi:hypothetical protein
LDQRHHPILSPLRLSSRHEAFFEVDEFDKYWHRQRALAAVRERLGSDGRAGCCARQPTLRDGENGTV